MKIGEIRDKIQKRNPKIAKEVKADLAFQVGRMVMNARLITGMTQEMLAKKVATKQPAIARVESGFSLPNLSFLDKLAKKAFHSYLIPPRFAFLQEGFFVGQMIKKDVNLESGTLNKNEHSPKDADLTSPFFSRTETNTRALSGLVPVNS